MSAASARHDDVDGCNSRSCKVSNPNRDTLAAVYPCALRRTTSRPVSTAPVSHAYLYFGTIRLGMHFGPEDRVGRRTSP